MRGALTLRRSFLALLIIGGVAPACAQTPLRAGQYEQGAGADGLADEAMADDSAEAGAEDAADVSASGDGSLTSDGFGAEGLDANALLREGLVDDGMAPDGAAAGEADTRDSEDAGLFAIPNTTIDPLLFQIEDIDPLLSTDRRPARLARLEPYDPVGIRVGSFVLFPEAEIGTVWTDNVFKSQGSPGDAALEFKPAARLVSNWSTHAIELRGVGDLSRFDEYDTEDDRGYLAEARGRLDITRRSNLQALASHEVARESRSALDATTAGERAEITTERAALTFNQRFNRLRVQLRGAVADADYQLNGGSDERARDVTATEQAVRASWEFKPTLTAFVDAGINQREFGGVAGDGLRRDSDGQRLRAGFDLGSTSDMWRGEISIGWGRQETDSGAFGDASGLLIDANLAWRPTALTSVLFTASSEIDDTITPGAAFAISRSGAVEVRHALRRHLVLSAGVAYLDRDIVDSDISEEQWLTSFGVDYFVNREVVLVGRYQHTNFDSTLAGGDWSADEVRFGVKVRR